MAVRSHNKEKERASRTRSSALAVLPHLRQGRAGCCGSPFPATHRSVRTAPPRRAAAKLSWTGPWRPPRLAEAAVCFPSPTGQTQVAAAFGHQKENWAVLTGWVLATHSSSQQYRWAQKDWGQLMLPPGLDQGRPILSHTQWPHDRSHPPTRLAAAGAQAVYLS